jgi:NAD(P)H-flavin reductase/hemoglobin-like flavoprotein
VTEVLAVDGEHLMAHRAQSLGLIREGFTAVSARPDVFASELYEDFFTANPRYRKYFGTDAERRDAKTLETAIRVVAELDKPGTLLPYLRKLALEYRKYGVREVHYRAFAGSVMTALERTIGPAWSFEAAEAWVDELTMVASAMLGIAAEADAQGPAYWEAEVVSVERIAEDVVSLKARPAFAYDYRPGQYAAVEVGRLPWVWRDFSFASAPRREPDGGTVLEFHVQRSASGQVTTVIHDELQPGDRIRVSTPAGELAFPAGASRLIAVGHGTGIAPIAALLEEAVEQGDDRPLHIVVGNSRTAAKKAAGSKKKAAAGKAAAAKAAAATAAATAWAGVEVAEAMAAGDRPEEPGHYLSERLEKLARAHGHVTVTYIGEAETLPEKLAAYVAEVTEDGTLAGWGGVAVGATPTVQACLDVLAAAGADPADVRSDLFG